MAGLGWNDWPASRGLGGRHPMDSVAGIRGIRILVVDVSKSYTVNSYFEIEKSVLGGKPHSTCGGRVPNDDVMDTLFTLFINRGHGPEVGDGVDKPTRPAKEAFPYLAAPDDGIFSAIKVYLARLMVKYAP